MNKKLVTLAIAAATPLAAVLPSSSANALEPAPDSTLAAATSSTPDFASSMKKKAKVDPEARKALRQYESLSAQQQAQLNEAIRSGKAAQALGEAIDSSGMESITTHGGFIRRSGGAGASTTQTSSFRGSDGVSTLSTVYDVSGSYRVEQRVFGVLITRLNQDFYWQTSSGRVTATKRCYASATNFNFVINLSSDTDHWIQGTHGVCQTIWHGNVIYKGSGVRMDKKQWFEVDGKGYYSRWLKNI